MVRTIVTPEQQNISILVPQDYVGKKIEVLLYALEEIDEKEQPITAILPKKKPSDFAGIFTKEEGEKFDKHIQQMRGEWERDI